MARGVYLTRELVTLPGNLATPRFLAERARKVALDAGLRYRAIEMAGAERLGMGAFLAVARGSDEPAVMVEMDAVFGSPYSRKHVGTWRGCAIYAYPDPAVKTFDYGAVGDYWDGAGSFTAPRTEGTIAAVQQVALDAYFSHST